MVRVSEVMIKDPVCCTPNTKINELKSLLDKYHCSKLPVVNTLKERRIIGVINRKDLVTEEGNAVKFMEKNLKAIGEDETVGECLKLMIMNNIEQVPVIDKQGHFCGIVTQNEILNY